MDTTETKLEMTREFERISLERLASQLKTPKAGSGKRRLEQERPINIQNSNYASLNKNIAIWRLTSSCREGNEFALNKPAKDDCGSKEKNSRVV